MQDWQLAGRPGRIFKFGDGPTHRDCQRRMLSVPVQAARPVFASHVWPAKPGLHSRTRTHMPGPSGLPAFRPSAPRLGLAFLMFELDENKRTRAQVKSNIDSRRCRHPRSQQRNKVKQSNLATTKIDGSFVGKLLYVCRPDPILQSTRIFMNSTPIITCSYPKSRLRFNVTGSRQNRKESWNPSLYPASDGGWVYLLESASVQ